MVNSWIQPLASLLKAEQSDIPHLYLIHGATGKAIMYPTKLDDVNNFSPELILAWAHSSIIETELEMNRHHQDYLHEAIKAGPQKIKQPNMDTGKYEEIEVGPKEEDLEAV